MPRKKKECECEEYTIVFKMHQMNPTKMSARPSAVVCTECQKRTDVKAVGFTLHVMDKDA